ncbi:MAG: phosphoglycerate dehydrogenase [Aggregatilineales bacterium]
MTYNVLVATVLADDALIVLRQSPDVTVTIVKPESSAVLGAIGSADALLIRDDVPVDAHLLNAAKRLKVIGRAGAGLAGIDVDTATARGVIVMNTPGTNAIAVAEHTMTLLLALSRDLIAAHTALVRGAWERTEHTGLQLYMKTLALVGLGRVGRDVAERALAFGMDVIACDPYVAEAQVSDLRLKLVSLDEALARADFLSLHCAVTPETRGLFNAETLAKLKPGARIINTAHGSLIDEVALAEAIRSGRVAGAALDVFAVEPPGKSPLIGLPGVIHTPHLGDATIEAQRDLSAQIVGQALDALRGTDYRNAVNMPFMPGREFEAIMPYLRLAERIGALQHHLARGRIRRVAVEYKGDELTGLVKPLSVALLTGILSPSLGDSVNYINAPLVAMERGIHVTQTKGLDVGDYPNLVSCQVHWEGGGQLVISGALFNHVEPRIVQIDSFRTDFVPEGTLLVFGSYDVPGVIGKVGTLLAKHNINIAAWRTGRVEKGGQTLTVVTIDQPVSDALLTEFRAQDYVRHALQIAL